MVPNVKNPPKKISSPKVISRVILCKFQKTDIASVSGCLPFTFKICQIVAGSGMIHHFHDILRSSFWRDFDIRPNFETEARQSPRSSFSLSVRRGGRIGLKSRWKAWKSGNTPILNRVSNNQIRLFDRSDQNLGVANAIPVPPALVCNLLLVHCYTINMYYNVVSIGF